MSATCRSCGAPIVWLLVGDGPHPCDEKLEMGIEEIEPVGGRRQGRMVKMRTSHFATCPDAAMWRRKTTREVKDAGG